MAGSGKLPEINWEDDDDAFGKPETAEKAEVEDDPSAYEALLDDRDVGDGPGGQPRIVVGEKVRGVVSAISATSNDVLVDLGSKMSGVIAKTELLDDAGQLKVKSGETIEAFVLSKRGGEITLSYSMSQSLKSIDDLEAAAGKKLPVRGRVIKLNKGGFEVMVLGKPAFCPISQMDTRFVESGEEYVGKDFDFMVEKFEERGRNIVVSRAALLRAQAEIKLKELLTTLTPDTVLDGIVTEVRDFGAFVDIGGVEGMVHVSELSYARTAKATDAVRKGEKVRVKILKIEGADTPKPKISLSIKAAAQNPWEDVDSHVESGKTYTGRVVSVQPFGAFVEVKPGFEGLVHVSEMVWGKRIHHPSDVVKVGDTVTVSVKDIDKNAKRISLTMKQVEDDPWYDAAARFPAGTVATAPVSQLKPFGAVVDLAPGMQGLLPLPLLKRRFGEAYKGTCTPGKLIEVKVIAVDATERRVQLTVTGIEEDGDARGDYLEFVKSEKAAQDKRDAEASSAAGGAKVGDGPRAGSFGALLSAKLGQKR